MSELTECQHPINYLVFRKDEDKSSAEEYVFCTICEIEARNEYIAKLRESMKKMNDALQQFANFDDKYNASYGWIRRTAKEALAVMK